MAMQTNTKVAAVSKIKMATALLFLGAAALAASAAGGLAGRGGGTSVQPDLVIRKMKFEKGSPEGKGSHQDKLTVYYMNTGSGAVNDPFNIIVRVDPAPYTEGGTQVQWLSHNSPAGSGFSGAYSAFLFKDADAESPHHYVIPVESLGGTSASLPNLNKFNVAPGEWGHIDVYLPKYYQDMLKKGYNLSIDAKVDYTPGNNSGKVAESNEKNNQSNIQVKASSLSLLEKNFCEMDYNPTYIYPPCVEAGLQYACVDKYTGQFKGCSPDVKACAEYTGNVLACDVDLTVSSGEVSLSIESDVQPLPTEYVIAGKTNQVVAKIKVEAFNENVIINDLVVFSSSSAPGYQASPEDTFQLMKLYAGNVDSGNLLSATNDDLNGPQLITFENIDYIVEEGTVKYFYITVDTLSKPNGGVLGSTLVVDLLDDSGTVVTGQDSNTEIIPEITGIEPYKAKSITVVGGELLVESNFPGGTMVGGNQTIHKFSLTNLPNNNNVIVRLRDLDLVIHSDLGESNIKNIELCSVAFGECDPLKSHNTYSNGLIEMSLYSTSSPSSKLFPDNTDINIIDSGETKEFVIKANLYNTTDKFLQVEMKNTGSWGMSWVVEDYNENIIQYLYGMTPSILPNSWPNIFGGVLY